MIKVWVKWEFRKIEDPNPFMPEGWCTSLKFTVKLWFIMHFHGNLRSIHAIKSFLTLHALYTLSIMAVYVILSGIAVVEDCLASYTRF